jgi:hypothetical protein
MTTLPEPDLAVIRHVAGGQSHECCDALDYLFFDDFIHASMERRAAMPTDHVFVCSLSPIRTVNWWMSRFMYHFKRRLTLINPLPSGRIAVMTWGGLCLNNQALPEGGANPL